MSIFEKINSGISGKETVFKVLHVDNDQLVGEMDIPIALNNPYAFDVSRFLPNQEIFTLPMFFDLVRELVEHHQDKDNVSPDLRVKVSEEYPPEDFINFGDEIICYRVLKREPARMDAKGTGRVQRKGTYGYEYKNAHAPGRVLVVDSRPIDHKIEFTCWAKTNKIANKRALWFEKLLVNHSWAFEVSGAERFHWIDRGADTYTTSNSQRLVYRPLNFFLRFREFEIKTYPTIKNIVLENKLL
tara:strand:- start:697 stop:1425 length:729 start_codon:yes stop_codon:yes gene_type:complete